MEQKTDNGAINYLSYINGDDKGFYELVKEYFDGLCAFIFGITGDRGLSEELADDTFYRIAVKKPHYGGASSFRTWLYSIGRHVALDACKKKKHDCMPLDEANNDADSDSPERAYLSDERNKTLYRALDKLKPEYRQILWLVYFENMSSDEAAEVLKKSKNSTYVLLHRAKDSLKSKLEEEGFDYEIL